MKRLGIIVVAVVIVGAAFFWFSRGASANQLQEACGRATGKASSKLIVNASARVWTKSTEMTLRRLTCWQK